jgi:hypothetical protein
MPRSKRAPTGVARRFFSLSPKPDPPPSFDRLVARPGIPYPDEQGAAAVDAVQSVPAQVVLTKPGLAPGVQGVVVQTQPRCGPPQFPVQQVSLMQPIGLSCMLH